MKNKKVEELKYNNNGQPKKAWKPKAYTPETLNEVFELYLEERAKEVRYRNEAIKSGDRAGEIIQIPINKSLSLESFCVFADIMRNTFLDYERQKEYLQVAARIRETIEADQLDGATVGVYNPSIVVRKLGLGDNVNVSTEGTQQIQLNLGKKIGIDKK
ncbi:hypothetical protein D0T49_04215 [Paludibacter sp. 221]|uniref:terminase small subunit n=1 Tax=Paludibacter sp. 221 TaxID=2302939 RepID=UPI0013D4C2FA|nr:terminase small subunit [Paludibacter sp. 221]NDV46244.1 hypothetical protein [Paludibacter sp. 221]